jgi:hypothetical protein
MRSTYRILMLSTVLLGAPLAMAQAQTMAPGASPGNNMAAPGAMQNAPAEPVGAYSSVEVLLTSANQAIAAGQTGLANQRLAWAKTKIISRWVPKTNGPQTYSAIASPVLKQINDARFALSKNDPASAQQIITQALASNAPELSY